MRQRFGTRAVAVALCAAAASFIAACSSDNDDDDDPVIGAPALKVLSSRPELVTGGDALIELTLPQLPSGANQPTLSVSLNGSNVSSAFRADPQRPGVMLGVVSGMANGANTLTASYGGEAASLALSNYPITGPVLSGPHVSPHVCQTQSFQLPAGGTLGASSDANCSAPTVVQYVYRSTAGSGFTALPSMQTLPADVAMTTTTTGQTVPFVVRVETGTMNRGIYQNVILHDPTSDPSPSPVAPPRGWNKRLIAMHGSGCTGGWYIQGGALGANLLDATRLGEGYALFTNTLNHPSNSCNALLAGETTMMGKEHFIQTFGVPLYTVSTGGSGGAYTSLQVADSFPGLFDGVLISATYPDALSIALSGLDSRLLSNYLLTTNPASISEAQMTIVSGHKTPRAWYDLALQSGRTDPVPGRVDPIPAHPFLGAYGSAVWNAAVPMELRYDPATNPSGARPTVFDVARNVYGVDPATGFALRPFDNVGVQYGLDALNAGAITSTQFLDLNEMIGGYDQDANYTAMRSVGDAGAIRRAYQSGLTLGGGGGLASIPVFDTSLIFDDDQFYHYQWFHFAVRERMLAANGDTGNHVMWRGGLPIGEVLGPPAPDGAALNQTVTTQSWNVFIQWLEAYKADSSTRTDREKVIANKPAAAVDGCWTRALTPQFIAEPQTLSSQPDTTCNQLWPSYTYPRRIAGAPVSANVLKCQLKPIDAADYTVAFTQPELARLNAIFPNGVCDWSKPGVEQTGVVPYASFGPAPGNKVFDVSAR